MKQRSFAKTAVLMGIIILFSKIMGLVRDVMIAGTYGTTMYAVAYETASKLPVTIFDFVLGGVVTSAFIPVYNSISVRDGKAKALSFAQSYLNLILTVTAVLSLIGVAFAPQLVYLMAPELSAECALLAAYLTRIMFPMVIFVGLAFTFVGFLQSEGEYNIPAVISLVSNLIMVGYLALSGFFTDDPAVSATGLSVAMLIGWMAQAAVQIPSVAKRGFRMNLRAPLITEDTKRAARNALPILAATWTTPVFSLINTRLASGIENGRAINALGYANRLYIIIVGLFSFVATNLLFPYMARAAASGDTNERDRLTRVSIRVLVFIIAPISAGVAVLAEPFVALIYENGSFTAADTAITSEALRFYAVGMIFTAVCEVLTKAFFSVEKTKLPMISAAISMIFNIAVIAVFGSDLGVGGIALVSGLAAAVNMAANLIFALRQGLIGHSGADIADILKSLLSTAVMAAAVWAVYRALHGMGSVGSVVSFALSVLTGVVVYAIASFILKSAEIRGMIDSVRKK